MFFKVIYFSTEKFEEYDEPPGGESILKNKYLFSDIKKSSIDPPIQ